jgi:hypothetical protein
MAASYQALHNIYREREAVLVTAMADRTDWERATYQQRQLAVAADTELRRRRPGESWPPLRSVEPEPSTNVQHDNPALTPEADLEQIAQRISDLAAQHREFADKLAQRQSQTIPAEDPDYEQFGQAFPDWEEHRTDAILKPPRPQIPPSGQVMERIADRDLDMEAAN